MKKSTIFMIILAALVLSACGGNSDEPAAVPESAVVEAEPVVAEVEPVVVEPEQVTVEEVQEAGPVVEEQAAVVEEPAVAEPVAEEPIGDSLTFYTSPEDIFTIEVPAGWAKETDNETIEDTVIETFTAPDGNASVQVLVNEVASDTTAVEKGQYTLDYMKRLLGEDLRIATDVQLEDGCERLEWWSDKKGTTGMSYFDIFKNHLFVFTVWYDDDYEDDYILTLNDVADSFTYPIDK